MTYNERVDEYIVDLKKIQFQLMGSKGPRSLPIINH